MNQLNNDSFPHTYNTSPRAGKLEKREGPYYINSTQNHVCYLVNQTENNTMLQGQNIQMDSLYTSVLLANNNTSEKEEFQKYVITSQKIKMYVYVMKLK